MRKIKIIRTLVAVSVLASVIYCLHRNSWNPLLCTEHLVKYSRNKTTGTLFLKAQTHYLHSELLGEILMSYQHFHEVKRRAMVAGEVSNTLTWYCISDCNGVGDRIKGIYAAFLLAIATNRTFFIHQSDEVQRTMLLEPNAIDWAPLNRCTVLDRDQTAGSFGRLSFIQKKVFRKQGNFSLELNRLIDSNNIYVSNKMGIFSLIRSIEHSALFPKLTASVAMLLHSVLTSGEDVKLHAFLSVLHQFLFHLPQNIQQIADLTLDQLGLKPRRFVTVHIRTGFKNRFLGEITFSKHFFEGKRFARTKESWRQIMECALNISEARFGKNSTILVASDDQEPKNWLASEYKSRVAMLRINPVHVAHASSLLGVTATTAYVDMWVELSVMSKSSSIVSIMSGYSEVASHMGSMDPFSLYIYSIQQNRCARMCCGILRL